MTKPISKILYIILWNDENITIAGKSIYWKDWQAADIGRLCDLLNENSKLLSYEDFCGLIAAIPDKWKRAALRLETNFSKEKMKRLAENSCSG